MPTYSKETALYDTGAIAAGIDAAGDTADTYITAVNQDGIKIHAANNVNSNYAAIDATGMDVVRGGTSMAKFGETTRIGENNKSHMMLDYHSMRLMHPDLEDLEEAYFQVGDLRDRDGNIVEEFHVTTIIPSFTVSYPIVEVVSVAVDGTETTAYTVSGNTVTLDELPSTTSLIAITYSTSRHDLQMFTFGSRMQSGKTGAMSFSEGELNVASGDISHAEGISVEASGNYSHAEGYGSEASGETSHAEGYDCVASGANSHAQNNHTTAGYRDQTAIGKYNDNNADNAFEIGNGSYGASSNALAVSWDGAIESGISGIGATQWINVLKGSAALYVPKDPNGMTSAVGAVTMETSGGGAWTIANYTDEAIRLVYITPANRSAGVNTTTMPIKIDADGRVTTSRDINTTSSSGIFTLGSQITLSSFKFCQRGGVAAVLIGAKKSTATAANTVITVGTITEGRRPPFECAGTTPFGTGDCYVNESGVVSFRSTAQVAANTVFYVRVTYPVV